MFNSSVLDVAVGVVFVFLLLSVFATAINEVILSLFSLRGKYLLKGIAALLDDDTFGKGLVKQIYEHGQVFGLYRGGFDASKPGNLPSYIPSQNFALAFLDCVGSFSRTGPSEPAPQKASESPHADTVAVPEAQPNAAAAQLNVPVAQPAMTVSQQVVTITAEFKAAANALAANKETQKIGKPLVSMIAMAGNDAAKLQKSVEDWFNSCMDRVSGHYKYHTQFFLLLIGLILSVAMNADTIHIFHQLSNDSTLRGSILAAATSAAAKPTPNPAAPVAADGSITTQIHAADTALQNVNDLGLPFGWPRPGATTDKNGAMLGWDQRFANGATWVFYENPSMILGWLLTAIAISLGAPFWFDALNKIMVIRSTIKPREKSQDEGSKDKPKT